MSDYSVRAVISAKDDGFTRTFASALETVQALQTTLSHGLDFSRISRASQSAFAGIVSDARTAAASVTSVTDAVSQAAAQTATDAAGTATDAASVASDSATAAASSASTASSKASEASADAERIEAIMVQAEHFYTATVDGEDLLLEVYSG